MSDTDADTDAVRRPRWVVPAVLVVVTVVVVAVAASVLVPRSGGGGARSSTGTACVEHPDAPTAEIGAQEATWVRFCPVDLAQPVRHPQGVVTGDLAASVADALWDTQVDRPVCEPYEDVPAGPTGHFRIEVGLADGRVADLVGDTGCSGRDVLLYSQLETTLLMEAAAAAGPPGPAPGPVTCPDRLTTEQTNRDGASADQLVDTARQEWLSTVPLLPMPAVAADVCAYTGRGRGLRLVGQWQVAAPEADTLRSTANLALDRGAQTDCGIDPSRTSYVVVLTDATGTARTFTIDNSACGVLTAAVGTPAVETWLGLARERLDRTIARSRH